jgi:hypothetical protein
MASGARRGERAVSHEESHQTPPDAQNERPFARVREASGRCPSRLLSAFTPDQQGPRLSPTIRA